VRHFQSWVTKHVLNAAAVNDKCKSRLGEGGKNLYMQTVGMLSVLHTAPASTTHCTLSMLHCTC
jgi:hypothetical protein